MYLQLYFQLINNQQHSKTERFRGFRAAAISAVTSATKRSYQLGGTSEDEIKRHGL
jgi:hypothetical protein